MTLFQVSFHTWLTMAILSPGCHAFTLGKQLTSYHHHHHHHHYGNDNSRITSNSVATIPKDRIQQKTTAFPLLLASHPPSKLGRRAPPPGPLRRQFPQFPWERLPNWLTYMRCLAIPGLALLFYLPQQHVATALVFAVASLTDWMDGYLARRWDIASDFGAFLDPVADKLMVSTALILLSGRYGPLVGLPSAIILAREIAVSALREWMAQKGQRDAVQVGFQGKVKTALTMVALTLLLIVDKTTRNGAFGSLFYFPAMFLLYASMVITVTSGSVYFMAAAPIFFRKDEKSSIQGAEDHEDVSQKSS